MNAPQRFSLSETDASGESTSALLRELALAQQRLRELEARLEAEQANCPPDDLAARTLLQTTLLDNLQDCVLIIDPAGRIAHVAGNSVGLLGYAPVEMIGPDREVGIAQLVDSRDHDLMLRALGDISERPRRTQIEARVIDRAGEWRWIEFTFVPLYGEPSDGLTGFQVILRDISDRVQAESMMRSLNEAAQTVQTASLSLDDVIEAVSSQLKALGFFSAIGLLAPSGESVRWVKFSADERRLHAIRELGRGVMALPPTAIPALAQALSTGRPVQRMLDETLLEHLLGDPAQARQAGQLMGPLWTIVAPLRADGHSLGFLVVASPSPRPESVLAIEAFANQTAIAVRNAQLVDRIAEREIQYRAIFEAARDGLLVLDEQGRIVAASEATCELLGCEARELVGRPLEALLAVGHKEIAPWLAEARQDASRGTLQTMAIRQGGAHLPIEMRSSRLGHAASTQLLVLITDISERMRAQEALIQAERLGALGQMAGGIAHDFNNTLVSILGHAQMAAADLAKGPEGLADHLAQIEMGARDAADAVSRLQALYRETDDKSDFIPVQLDDILLEALALNRPRWKDIPQMQGVTIHVETRLDRPTPVYGNPSELKRVLSNLIINAIDAMPEGGLLYFETGECGPYSQVLVRDSGEGIAPEDRPRIFEPFYTTKKSSGLGLTISQSIVERHGGLIEVESEPGVGTTFVIRLPMYAGQAVEEEPLPPATVLEGEPVSLSILVVDDEPGVRGVLARLLERAGHQVHTADSGQMGIAALEQERYDLLICDFGMPDVQGPKVMQRAYALYPEMPIVLTTGWGDSITPEQLRNMRAMTLLSKPFGQEEVRRMLERVLQAREPDS
jgi:PAS domain S-box-containing protein